MSTAVVQGTWKRWFVTLGGSGMSPVAPGPVGSLAAVIVLGIVFFGARETSRPLTPTLWNIILAAGILIYGALCVALGKWATEYYGRKDPGACVLDEGAGICLTALFVPIYPGWRELWALLAVFVFFRIFDIVKLAPAKRLEKLPYGWGILLDDLAAAVYANVLCQVIVRWLVI